MTLISGDQLRARCQRFAYRAVICSGVEAPPGGDAGPPAQCLVADGMVFNTALVSVSSIPPACSARSQERVMPHCGTGDAVAKIFGGAKASDAVRFTRASLTTRHGRPDGWTLWNLGVPLGAVTRRGIPSWAAVQRLHLHHAAESHAEHVYRGPGSVRTSITATAGDYSLSSVGFMDADSTDLDALEGHAARSSTSMAPAIRCFR